MENGSAVKSPQLRKVQNEAIEKFKFAWYTVTKTDSKEPDISVVLTAHSEGVVSGPTLHSAEVAITQAEKHGFRVERIIGLDCPTALCRAYFSQPALTHWRHVEIDKRDLGLARNALARQARGRWIAFLDADDLFSENWLSSGGDALRKAEKNHELVIIHPEINVFFDAANSVVFNINSFDDFFTQYYYFNSNYYDSLSLAPRLAFLENSYKGRDTKRGFGYEDWYWNIETAAEGWKHLVVSDTIIFKRRQDISLVVELNQKNSLLWNTEKLAIEQVRKTS